MNELSIAEKAKRYDKAIETAKALIRDYESRNLTDILFYVKEDLSCIFPELKESEDERVRNWLIGYFHQYKEDGMEKFANGLKVDSILDWLEKQSGQKAKQKTMFVKFICKKDWHGIGDYSYGKIYNGYPCENEQKGYDVYDDNHVPTFCDEDFINEYFNIVTEEKQGTQKEYTFKSIPRLLDMIEPTSSAKVYCQKLIDTLVKEGYTIDAKIVEDCLKQMNGEAVPMATMDEQQKPSDKVEPKFHEGEWIVYNNDICQIVKREEGCNKLITIFGIEKELVNERNLSTARHWTIQDAKDGDALVASDNSIFIFAGVVDSACKYYAVLTSDHTVQINKDVEGGYWETAIAVHPATKEQCDILMKAIDDAGYTFNFELKKIVQKPMPEHIFRIGDTLRRKGKDYTFIVDRIQGGYYHCDHNNGAFFPIEEQDEWELVDKVEPKFKVGDWCIDEEDGTIFQIVKVLNNTYTYRTNEGDEYSCTHYSLENDARHWTMLDAKDGDVLAARFNIIICKSPTDYDTRSYCRLASNSFIDKEESGWDSTLFYPATKEQRDDLKMAISDAGYEWDATKKELKRIEPKFKIGDWIVSILGTARIIGVNDSNKYQLEYIDGKQQFLSIDYVNYAYDKWSIQDAKDGDVLVTDFEKDNMIVMYHSMCTKDTINVHCCLDNKIICSNLGVFDAEDVKPATKEQRDVLERAMTNAGYRWNKEKLKLEKI